MVCYATNLSEAMIESQCQYQILKQCFSYFISLYTEDNYKSEYDDYEYKSNYEIYDCHGAVKKRINNQFCTMHFHRDFAPGCICSVNSGCWHFQIDGEIVFRPCDVL